MKLLAIDTSNQPLSVAVMDDDQVLATATTNVQRGHSSDLLPIIEELMQRAHLQVTDLDRFVVAQGPGSYTGLRIGVTTAKTFAATLKKQLAGVSSLRVLAGNVSTPGQLVASVMDARRGNVFTGLYQIDPSGLPVTILADQHIDFVEWLKIVEKKSNGDAVVFVGPDANKFTDQLADYPQLRLRNLTETELPQASVLGVLGARVAPVKDIDHFVPNYLRLTQAETEWLAKHPKEDHAPYVEKI